MVFADWMPPVIGLNVPYGKNRGTAQFAAHELHVGNGVDCPWELSRANKAAHYFHIWKQWADQWVAQ